MIDILEVQKQVIAKYKTGLCCRQIAEELDLYSPVVTFLLKAADIEIKPYKPTHTKPRKVLPLNKIKRLYLKENYDILDLSIEFDVSTTLIVSRLKEMGVKLKGRKLKTDEFDVEEIERMYWEEKMSSGEIAELYGVSGMTILKYMEANKIPKRKTKNREEKRRDGLYDLDYKEIQPILEVA